MLLFLFPVLACTPDSSKSNPESKPISIEENTIVPEAQEPSSPEDSSEPDNTEIPDDVDFEIQERLSFIEGMEVTEIPTDGTYRFFELYFSQPIDHTDPGKGSFTQFLTLIHKDINAPMVLGTTGYHNYYYDRVLEPTQHLRSNQLIVEHRYFSTSIPENPDWSYLTIEQAAADHHRIVEVLKPVYDGKWLSTGASKGGMTSVYHRRFYPDDVDATLAYVAPISFGAPDLRYYDFFDEVIDPQCLQKVRSFQYASLTRWDNLFDLYLDAIEGENLSFELAGSYEAAFEDLIRGFEWWFWQYLGMEYCDTVPGTDQSDVEFFDVLLWQGIKNASDESIGPFRPYYYQAVTQLGYPRGPDHLSEYLQYPFAHSTLPEDAGQYSYDPDVMEDIQSWVFLSGERIMFVYGEYDPWTAGAFGLGNAQDSYIFTVPEGTHGASISLLPTDQANEAIEILDRWMDAERSSSREWQGLPPLFEHWEEPRITFYGN